MNNDITNLELLELLSNSIEIIHRHIDEIAIDVNEISFDMKNSHENSIKIGLKCPYCNNRLDVRVIVDIINKS